MSAANLPDGTSGAPAPREFIGQVLRGTYRIERELDRGGMGMVFAAEHTRLRRPVAVKILARHLTEDENALARFQREAEIVSQLQHPHVVSILDYDTTDEGEPYIVMELLHGESLASLLAREHCIAVADTVRLVSQIAGALGAAHGAGIVHRDLKPANIFLVSVPGAPHYVKLLDFGISKTASAAQSERRVTREFDVLGTPDYMAPEQALGRTAQVDHRGDQFALAVITYEMLSGRMPFEGENVGSILYRVAHTHPTPLSHVAAHVPLAIDAVLGRALAKQAGDRFPNVLEFAQALAIAAGHPLSAPPALSTPASPSNTPPNDSHLRATANRGEARAVMTSAPTLAGPDAGSWPAASAGGSLNNENRWAPASVAPQLPPSADQDRKQLPPASAHTGRAHPSSAPPTPSRRSASKPVERVQAALKELRQAAAFDEIALAVDYALSAVRIVRTTKDQDAAAAMEAADTLLQRVFVACLGGLERRLVLRQIPSAAEHRMSSDEAFLISRVWDGDTVEHLLDMGSMPRLFALSALVSLKRSGILDTE